jgi:hypothetical protein
MKKNKRDNAKTPTNNTVAKLNPTPQKRTLNTRARAHARGNLLIRNLSQSLTKKITPKTQSQKKTQLQENSRTNTSLTQNEDQSKAKQEKQT